MVPVKPQNMDNVLNNSHISGNTLSETFRLGVVSVLHCSDNLHLGQTQLPGYKLTVGEEHFMSL